MPDNPIPELIELLNDHQGHLVDALNAAANGAPQAAAISLANAEVILEKMEGVCDATPGSSERISD